MKTEQCMIIYAYNAFYHCPLVIQESVPGKKRKAVEWKEDLVKPVEILLN